MGNRPLTQADLKTVADAICTCQKYEVAKDEAESVKKFLLSDKNIKIRVIDEDSNPENPSSRALREKDFRCPYPSS